MTAGVKILTRSLPRAWAAVANMAAAVRVRAHEAANLGGERMMLPVASPVEPQDRPGRAVRGQRVQHCQDGGRPDSRAQQHNWPISGLQDKAPTRRADVERIAHPDVLAEVRSGGPMRLDLHADSI